MNTPHLLAFTDSEAQATRVASLLGAPLSLVEVHEFPDGECKIRLPASLPEGVVVLRSLNQPNAKLTELLLTARTARELGVRHLMLVAPYLCYMRQDIAFTPGEAVSQRIVGKFLAELFDSVITVDPHLHRVHELRDAIPARNAIALSAAPLIGKFLRTQLNDALIVGPDEESAQWAQTVAQHAGWSSAVARKTRAGDRSVTIVLPEESYAGRTVVLVDDMISTGHTLAQCARALYERGAREVHCAVTHALCDAATVKLLRDAGVKQMWCSDSIAHECSTIELAPLLAEAISKLHTL